MRYFYDTEFVEDGHTSDLISIAVVADDGRELYLHVDGYDAGKAQAHAFVSENVLPHVAGMPKVSRDDAREMLTGFFLLGQEAIDLWGYFPAWDHIALMQLWGDFSKQPTWLPMRTNDVCTFAQLTNLALLGRVLDGSEHSALADARWTRDAFNDLARRVA